MKPRYLDKRNCHTLLPKNYGLPVLQRLDNCLSQINDKPGEFYGLVDQLIRQNENTINKKPASSRLLNVQIDVAQALYPDDKAINTQVRDRPFPGPIQLYTVIQYENGTAWKSMIPLQYLLKGWGDASAGHQCYVHAISKNVPRTANIDEFLSRQLSVEDTYYYVGITGRNWLERLSEHIAETRRGNRRLFYQALRESVGWQSVLYISSLLEVNQSFDDAMNWEEVQVDNIAGDHYGLNMIPGGFKGLQNLHKLGFTKKIRVSLEERDRAISEFIERNPRKGIPNPFIKAWWEDDENYEKVNEANPKRFSIEQRKEIRRLYAEGASIQEIQKQVGALNERQIKDFLSGKTYKRGSV